MGKGIDVKETFYCDDEDCWESFRDSVPSSCPVCGGTKFITELEHKQREYRERNAIATKESHEELALGCIGCLAGIFMLFVLLWALGYVEAPELPNSWKINPYKDWKAD